MKTDAVGWPAGKLRRRADARPRGCVAALFGPLVWRRRLGSSPTSSCWRYSSNPLVRDGDCMARVTRYAAVLRTEYALADD
jgi:hypothetical protein